VLQAVDAASALLVVEGGVPIDLVFTDVVMPGPLKSTELARRVRELSPSTRVLFTSGYTQNSIVHGGRLDVGIELLSKPYSRDTLAHRIRKMLDQSMLAERDGAAPADAFAIGEAAASHSPHSPPLAAGEPITLLYVEDEPLIREGTAEMLGAMGYVVHQAENAKEALAVLNSRCIDIMITDIGLPDVSGDQLARIARTDFPGLGIIFATGRDTTPLLPRSLMLRKPYDSFAIEAAIRKIAAHA
jgi:CheY-like chemotaxis protein